MKEINELPATPGVINSDLLATKKGSTDYRATIGQLAATVLSNLSAQDVMDLVQMVDDNNSGLNSNFLQGATRAFLQNASNLNAGTVPNARLPNGSMQVGSWSDRIELPTFLTGGLRVMVQYGYTVGYPVNASANLTFSKAFVGGIGVTGSNTPVIVVSPQVFPPSGTSSGAVSVGLDIRPTNVTLTGCTLHTIQSGNMNLTGTQTAFWLNNAMVRAHWFAIGRY